MVRRVLVVGRRAAHTDYVLTRLQGRTPPDQANQWQFSVLANITEPNYRLDFFDPDYPAFSILNTVDVIRRVNDQGGFHLILYISEPYRRIGYASVQELKDLYVTYDEILNTILGQSQAPRAEITTSFSVEKRERMKQAHNEGHSLDDETLVWLNTAFPLIHMHKQHNPWGTENFVDYEEDYTDNLVSRSWDMIVRAALSNNQPCVLQENRLPDELANELRDQDLFSYPFRSYLHNTPREMLPSVNDYEIVMLMRYLVQWFGLTPKWTNVLVKQILKIDRRPFSAARSELVNDVERESLEVEKIIIKNRRFLTKLLETKEQTKARISRYYNPDQKDTGDEGTAENELSKMSEEDIQDAKDLDEWSKDSTLIDPQLCKMLNVEDPKKPAFYKVGNVDCITGIKVARLLFHPDKNRGCQTVSKRKFLQLQQKCSKQ
jgi:hypothetical protein